MAFRRIAATHLLVFEASPCVGLVYTLDCTQNGEANMNRTVAYLRVSTTDQNLEGQRDAIAAWAKREGVEVEVIEEEASGATMQRPGWSKVETAIRAGKVDRVVVVALDRLGRTMAGLVELFEDLDRRGVELVSLREGIDGSSAAGRMMRGILASVAQFEREVRAERQAAGIAAAKARGKVLGGRAKGARNAKTIAVEGAARKMLAAGATVAEIARACKVSRTTVYAMKARPS